MEIDSQAVTTCDVSHDGGAIRSVLWPILSATQHLDSLLDPDRRAL